MSTPPEVNPDLFGDQSEYVKRCMAELQTRTATHDQMWDLGEASWQADLTAGTLTFRGPRYTVETQLQVVGTYNTTDGSWLWGWDHPSVPPARALAAGAVRDFAEQHGLSALLERKPSCQESDAWAFTALAAGLQEAEGAYRGPSGQTLVFMTFMDVRLRQPQELN